MMHWPRKSSGAPGRTRRGLTLVEVLVALLVSVILIVGITTVYIQISRASTASKTALNAHSAARAAVDRIATDLRLLRLDPVLAYQQFDLVDGPLAYGDGIDGDGDAVVDEELFDALDDDADFVAADHDRHAVIGSQVERPKFVNRPDFGDARVDEDVRFSADEVSFFIPGTPRRRISYRIDEFDGQQNVLIRTEVLDPDPAGPYVEFVEPVIFDVVSLDIMAWNPNNDTTSPAGVEAYWTTEWDAETKLPPLRPLRAGAGVPPFKLPAAFLVSVTVNGDSQPLSAKGMWMGLPLKTVRADTVVTVESVTNDNRYFRFVRD